MFWIMLLLVVAMSVYLIRLRERASDRFAAATQPLPLSAADAPEAPLRLYLANDVDGSLAEKPIRFPLPTDPNARARVVLEKLLEEYASPGSLHPLNIGTGVEEVYLLPVPGLPASRGQLAVVNLTTAFVQHHPSGIEPETLTLLSMIATLPGEPALGHAGALPGRRPAAGHARRPRRPDARLPCCRDADGSRPCFTGIGHA